MINADVVRLCSSGLNTASQCADFIGGLPASRGAALLRLYRLRGAAAGIVDKMRPSVLAVIYLERVCVCMLKTGLYMLIFIYVYIIY